MYRQFIYNFFFVSEMMQFKIKNRKKSVFCNAWQCLQSSVLKSSVCGFFRSENVQPLCGLPVAATFPVWKCKYQTD